MMRHWFRTPRSHCVSEHPDFIACCRRKHFASCQSASKSACPVSSQDCSRRKLSFCGHTGGWNREKKGDADELSADKDSACLTDTRFLVSLSPLITCEGRPVPDTLGTPQVFFFFLAFCFWRNSSIWDWCSLDHIDYVFLLFLFLQVQYDHMWERTMAYVGSQRETTSLHTSVLWTRFVLFKSSGSFLCLYTKRKIIFVLLEQSNVCWFGQRLLVICNTRQPSLLSNWCRLFLAAQCRHWASSPAFFVAFWHTVWWFCAFVCVWLVTSSRCGKTYI